MFLKRNKNATRRWPVILAEIVILIALYFALRSYMQGDMLEGPLPEFQARDLQGETVSPATYQGQPLLIHFWATWCRVCKLEAGAVDAVSKDWPVLTIAMQSGTPDEIAAYLHEKGRNWRTIADESGTLADQFGVRGVPASFFIDENGRIRFKEMGYTTSLGMRLRLWMLKLIS